jgi:transcriptional regulator with GAF, ATPase, and Fis domain
VGDSPSIRRLRADLWRSVFSYDAHWYEQYLWDRMEDFSTFLIGETGTGKGSAASAIGKSGYIPFDDKSHRFVESFTGNFIEINLSQFSESLIESELFGHQKGAFTGAIEHHKGVFALCSKFGAIFLDEIGDATIPVQIKLLKVLEERGFTPVGSHRKLYFSGRVIAATNKSLGELHDNDLFRRDFYYRLCSNVINVPTLRQQIGEHPTTMEILLKHIIEKITGTSSEELLAVVFEVMQNQISPEYDWPGNVRELEQAVRCILLNKDHCSEIEGWCKPRTPPLQPLFEGTYVSASELLATYCATLYNEYGTYEDVARITELDPRTVKKYIQSRSGV